jgi:hypothetical protein
VLKMSSDFEGRTACQQASASELDEGEKSGAKMVGFSARIPTSAQPPHVLNLAFVSHTNQYSTQQVRLALLLFARRSSLICFPIPPPTASTDADDAPLHIRKRYFAQPILFSMG